MKNLFLLAVLAVLASTAIVGCQGGGETAQPPVADTTAPKKEAPMEEEAYMAMMSDDQAQLVEDAKAASPDAAKLTEESKTQPEGEKWLAEQIDAGRREFVQVYVDYSDKLKTVTPPAAHSEHHATLIAAVDAFSTAYTAMIDAPSEETTKAAQAAQADMEAAIQPYLAKEEAPAPAE
jgi:hypothetical protein